MNNKLPEKYENGFLHRVKRFFSNIFSRNKVVNEKKEIIKEEKMEHKNEENYFLKMKEESKKIELKEDIISILNNKPELINTLSIERLKELNNMYDEMIRDLEREIKKLERTIA